MKTRDKPIVIVHWETPMDELSRKATLAKLKIFERNGKLQEILEGKGITYEYS